MSFNADFADLANYADKSSLYKILSYLRNQHNPRYQRLIFFFRYEI